MLLRCEQAARRQWPGGGTTEHDGERLSTGPCAFWAAEHAASAAPHVQDEESRPMFKKRRTQR